MLTHSKISHFIVTIDNTRLEVRNKSYNIKTPFVYVEIIYNEKKEKGQKYTVCFKK